MRKVLLSFQTETKIILLTGQGTMESAIYALRHGAHEYLLKPARPKDILASVAKALARRDEEKRKRLILGHLENSLQQLKDAEGITEQKSLPQRITHLPEGTRADMARRELWRGTDKISLTATEGRLFDVFAENWGRVMTHNEIVLLVQGYDVAEWDAAEILRPLVSRLRKKLSIFPGGEKWIASVRGTGYVFDAEMQTERS